MVIQIQRHSSALSMVAEESILTQMDQRRVESITTGGTDGTVVAGGTNWKYNDSGGVGTSSSSGNTSETQGMWCSYCWPSYAKPVLAL